MRRDAQPYSGLSTKAHASSHTNWSEALPGAGARAAGGTDRTRLSRPVCVRRAASPHGMRPACVVPLLRRICLLSEVGHPYWPLLVCSSTQDWIEISMVQERVTDRLLPHSLL